MFPKTTKGFVGLCLCGIVAAGFTAVSALGSDCGLVAQNPIANWQTTCFADGTCQSVFDPLAGSCAITSDQTQACAVVNMLLWKKTKTGSCPDGTNCDLSHGTETDVLVCRAQGVNYQCGGTPPTGNC